MPKPRKSKTVRYTREQLPEPDSTMLDKIEQINDAGIDFSDVPELDLPAHGTEQVTLRLDSDVVGWFRKTGRGYQTRMRLALREHIRRATNRRRGELVELRPVGKSRRRFILRRVG